MNKGLIIALSVFGALLLVMGGAFMWAMSARNSLVNMDEGITGQWSQVENQLQRRNDLIPNLVSSVKGYAAHEKEIFENIADARARMAGAKTREESIAAANAVSSALSRLLLVVENYPVLKADQTFLRLMDELAGTENRISVERKRYNDAVQQYNAARRRFPTNFIADIFGFKEAAYFKVPEEAKAVPKVDFNK
ncbi:MAG: LemA family protein [Nitrospirae bacterium]|nr:LemA family protein [Nitrospirota bacterium]